MLDWSPHSSPSYIVNPPPILQPSTPLAQQITQQKRRLARSHPGPRPQPHLGQMPLLLRLLLSPRPSLKRQLMTPGLRSQANPNPAPGESLQRRSRVPKCPLDRPARRTLRSSPTHQSTPLVPRRRARASVGSACARVEPQLPLQPPSTRLMLPARRRSSRKGPAPHSSRLRRRRRKGRSRRRRHHRRQANRCNRSPRNAARTTTGSTRQTTPDRRRKRFFVNFFPRTIPYLAGVHVPASRPNHLVSFSLAD
ncbi:hypothetical protein BDV93DRAFT_97571 [Ceratobasidium sp. AG-I]|nr:hypothetical protein BDV93DRAFT_97571 [Ceratobasidium sp. AG-I]